MNETDSMFYGVIGTLIMCGALALAVAWLVLPFILISQLKAIREAVALASRQAVAASEREFKVIAAVEHQTKRTADACAALTQWQERAHGERH